MIEREKERERTKGRRRYIEREGGIRESNVYRMIIILSLIMTHNGIHKREREKEIPRPPPDRYTQNYEEKLTSEIIS